MYKIIFIDIDGTLRNSKRELTDRTKATVKKMVEKGILVVLTSGRPRKFTEKVSKETNASEFIICSNGGCIYNYKEEKELYKDTLDKEAVLKLYQIAKREALNLIVDMGDNRIEIDFKEAQKKTEEEMIKYFNEQEVIQCVLVNQDIEKMRSIRPELEAIQNTMIKNESRMLMYENQVLQKGEPIYYDVCNFITSKGNAIEKVCEMLDIDIKDSIGIGDHVNDIPMFEKVGYRVLMGNAEEEMKQYADEITKTNDEDGVAVFLEKLMEQDFEIEQKAVKL